MRYIRAILFILALLCASQAQSEEIAEGYELGEIVVSASRIEAETIGTVMTVTAEDIWNSGARTLDEAIDLLPGVYVRMASAGTPRIDIRGFRTRHVQLLLDGIPINDTYDGQFDPTTLPVENIARIKLTTGGGSVLYGQGGNGGIINIITRNPAQKIRGTVHTEIGQSDAYMGKFTFSSASDQWKVFLSGSPSKRDGYPLSEKFAATGEEDGDLRDHSNQTRNNLFASVGFNPSDQTLFGLTFNYVNGDNGVPAVVNYDKNDSFTKKPKYDRVTDLEGYSAQWAVRHNFNQPFTFKSWAYFNQLDLVEDRFDDVSYTTQAKNGASHAESNTQVIGANTQLQYLFAQKGVATIGLSLENDTWQSDGFSVDKKNVAMPFNEEQDLQVYTAALQYDVSPQETLGLVAGLSYHHQNRTGSGEGDVSYLLGGRYDLHKNTRLKASLARKVRFPSIRQLYEIGSGNTALKAERSLHYELGLTQTLVPGTSVSATGFVIDAKGFIEKDQNSLFQNFENYRFRGIELALSSNPTEALTVTGSYAYLKTENRSSGASKEALQYRPKNKAALEATYRIPFGLTAHASILYVADQVFYDSSTPAQQKALNNYTVVNVKLRQALLARRLELYLNIENLFDKNYEQGYGLPQPGRTAYAGLKLTY